MTEMKAENSVCKQTGFYQRYLAQINIINSFYVSNTGTPTFPKSSSNHQCVWLPPTLSFRLPISLVSILLACLGTFFFCLPPVVMADRLWASPRQRTTQIPALRLHTLVKGMRVGVWLEWGQWSWNGKDTPELLKESAGHTCFSVGERGPSGKRGLGRRWRLCMCMYIHKSCFLRFSLPSLNLRDTIWEITWVYSFFVANIFQRPVTYSMVQMFLKLPTV